MDINPYTVVLLIKLGIIILVAIFLKDAFNESNEEHKSGGQVTPSDVERDRKTHDS